MDNKNRKNNAIELMQRWVEEYVNKFNFCPFSKPSFEKDKIYYVEVDLPMTEILDELFEVAQDLFDTADEQTNTLIALNSDFDNFEFFWDFVGILEDFFESEGISSEIMIASFHPNYRFQNEPEKYAFTNRAPLPMLHFIQHQYLSRALEAYPEAATWPSRNKKFIDSKSSEYFKQKLHEISRT